MTSTHGHSSSPFFIHINAHLSLLVLCEAVTLRHYLKCVNAEVGWVCNDRGSGENVISLFQVWITAVFKVMAICLAQSKGDLRAIGV